MKATRIMDKQVIIDCFPESARRYGAGYAVVAIDVIRATTSAITAAALGRDCYTVESLDTAFALARRLDNPLLVGELAGDMPDGFHMNNSPVDLVARTDVFRPVVLLSTSGTRLIHEARQADAVFLACFRNFSYTARYLATRYRRIAVIGAGSRGEFREEDQMCCAWVAGQLQAAGFAACGAQTEEVIAKWRGAPPDACATGNSARYLRRSGQARDLDFVLTRIDDLAEAFQMRGQLVTGSSMKLRAVSAPVASRQREVASA